MLFQVNVRTAMSVGQASGLALATAARAGIPVAQYSPNEVKLAVAGYGGAEKAAVQAMVVRLLHLGAAAADRPTPPTRSRSRCATCGARRCRSTRDTAHRADRRVRARGGRRAGQGRGRR